MKQDDGYFNTRLSYEPRRDVVWKAIVEYLQRFVPNDARILELGAGYCSFINQIKASEKHALDISAITRKHAGTDVKVSIQNCTNLGSYRSNMFDAVFSSFLFEHLSREDLDRVMNQLRRIIRTGGVLITMLPNYKYISRHYFDDYTHLQVFSHISFTDYLSSRGFEPTEVQGRFIPYTFKSRLPKSAFLTRIYLHLPWRPFAGNMLVIARNPEYKPSQPTRQTFRRHVESPADPIAPASILKDGQPDPSRIRRFTPKPDKNAPSQPEGRDRPGQHQAARSRPRYKPNRSRNPRKRASGNLDPGE
ncbi:class I SAM-dependent methyltransferase [bacterium]|nr:class I SAM-dependent methyltransferase [candidate division CSSED10-310 bacterium]